MDNSFSTLLLAALKKSGHSQSDLARHLGISQPSVNAWLRGKNLAETSRVPEIALFLGVRSGWLLGDGGPPGEYVAPHQDPESRWHYTNYQEPAAAVPDQSAHWLADDEAYEYTFIWQTISSEQAEAPVKVGNICERLGIVLVEEIFPDHVCGSIQYTDGRYVIRVNKLHHSNRKRFTVAHELAHYIEHRHLIGDGVVDDMMYRSSLSSETEREANQIAARILMPDHLLEYVSEQENQDMDAVARRLGVSLQALSIRLGQPI